MEALGGTVDPDRAAERHRMVREQVRARGITDDRVLAALEDVPRHVFVPASVAQHAYEDAPLPIGCNQTISQPFMVAILLEVLRLKGGERVLDVGTGSGYLAALLSRLSAEVHSVERIPELACRAGEVLRAAGITNVRLYVGNGARGLPDEAPFDAIVVSAAAQSVPSALPRQLALDGRLAIPIGDSRNQDLLVVIRVSEHCFRRQFSGRCSFVPLVEADRNLGPAKDVPPPECS